MTTPSRFVPLTVVALAVMAGCKKTPTETSEPAERVDPGASVQAMAGRAPACDRTEAISWRGLLHAPAGNASLGVGDDANPDPKLTTSNIGSSGLDGVCTAFGPGAGGFGARFDLHEIHALRARADWLDRTGRRFSTGAVMIPDGNTLLIGGILPRAGCAPATVEYRNRGALVGQGAIGCAARAGLEGAYLVGRALVAALGGVGVEAIVDGDDFLLWQTGAIALRTGLPGNPVLIVDEIRLAVAAGPPARLLRTVVTGTGTPPGQGVITTIDVWEHAR